MKDPLISICIPTYERVEYLKRLLESIEIQKFRSFEVIITDDSKSDEIKTFIENYHTGFPLYYYKNTPSLGTAKNMLASRDHAHSEWIKIIHDDDFFASETAVGKLAERIEGTDAKYIFSGYNEYIENEKRYVNKTITQSNFEYVCKNSSLFFAHNVIGPPSVMMVHTSIKEVFDSNLRWFTDMEYYYRILSGEKAVYIEEPIINVSSNDTQVTTYTRTNPAVVIPEAIYLLNKHGSKIATHILAYDSWWRVFRNLGISSEDEVKTFVPGKEIPLFVRKMLGHQHRVPAGLLKNGAISKAAMTLSYLLNLPNLKK